MLHPRPHGHSRKPKCVNRCPGRVNTLFILFIDQYGGWCKYEKEFEHAETTNKNIFTACFEDMKRVCKQC